ncbi:MAG: hypothetical protein ABEJ83_00465 [Candidatus Nanohaloarchaea archaeon]
MVVLVLIALIGNIALLSTGLGGFKSIIGMNAQSNDAEELREKLYIPVRNVCVQGTSADNRTTSLTLSNKINVTLVSEERDPTKDQKVRATLVESSAQLFQTEKIPDCVIEFDSGGLHQVFEEEDSYKLEITNQGEQGGKPATEIKVTER